MRGRRPEPAAVKRAKGNPGRRPVGDAAEAAALPRESSGAPVWLNTAKYIKTDAAKTASEISRQFWEEQHDELVRLKLLKSTDEFCFTRYCRYAAEWITYTRVLDRDGAWYTTSSEHVEGIIRPHPAFRFRKDVEHNLKELEDRLGLSPVARQRIFMQLAARVPQQPQLPGMPAAGDQQQPPSDPAPGEMPFGFLGSSSVN